MTSPERATEAYNATTFTTPLTHVCRVRQQNHQFWSFWPHKCTSCPPPTPISDDLKHPWLHVASLQRPAWLVLRKRKKNMYILYWWSYASARVLRRQWYKEQSFVSQFTAIPFGWFKVVMVASLYSAQTVFGLSFKKCPMPVLLCKNPTYKLVQKAALSSCPLPSFWGDSKNHLLSVFVLHSQSLSSLKNLSNDGALLRGNST